VSTVFALAAALEALVQTLPGQPAP